MNPIKIDFVSDIACPWCAVGLASLERAIDRVRDLVDVELHFQPFELNPQMGPEGEDVTDHLMRKYRSRRSRSHKIRRALRHAARNSALPSMIASAS